MRLYLLKKLPWSWHLIAAIIFLTIAIVGATYSLLQAEKKKNALEAELINTQQRYQPIVDTAIATTLNFTHGLPLRNKSDDIVQDINSLASSTGVQIQSIQIRSREASETEYGSVEFAVALGGGYRATKAWLSELQSKHHAMAVNTLSMRQDARDVLRLESQISLILYVRN